MGCTVLNLPKSNQRRDFDVRRVVSLKELNRYLYSSKYVTGTLELNLNSMPAPKKKSRQCGLKQLPDNQEGKEVSMVSLFEQKRVNGWWPCISEETGERQLTVRTLACYL